MPQKKIEKEINEILITLTDKIGFNHSNEHLDAFTLAEAGLIELFQQSRQEEKEKLLERIKLEKKKIEYRAVPEGLEVDSEKNEGYNQAIIDLEKLKEEIKKRI